MCTRCGRRRRGREEREWFSRAKRLGILVSVASFGGAFFAMWQYGGANEGWIVVSWVLATLGILAIACIPVD